MVRFKAGPHGPVVPLRFTADGLGCFPDWAAAEASGADRLTILRMHRDRRMRGRDGQFPPTADPRVPPPLRELVEQIIQLTALDKAEIASWHFTDADTGQEVRLPWELMS